MIFATFKAFNIFLLLPEVVNTNNKSFLLPSEDIWLLKTVSKIKSLECAVIKETSEFSEMAELVFLVDFNNNQFCS